MKTSKEELTAPFSEKLENNQDTKTRNKEEVSLMCTAIEQRRKELGISRKEICDFVGICKKSYYLYAISNKPIPSDKLILFSKILNCSTDYLLGKNKYTHITVTDNTGALLADIGQNKIIEHSDCKVILS